MRSLRRGADSPVAPPSEPFAVRTGLKLVSAEEGRAAATLRIDRDGPRQGDTVDSDAINALVQATAAAAVGGSEGNGGGPSDIYITFVRPAPEHPLTAEARVVSHRGSLQSCEVDVRDWNGGLVAKALLSYRF